MCLKDIYTYLNNREVLGLGTEQAIPAARCSRVLLSNSMHVCEVVACAALHFSTKVSAVGSLSALQERLGVTANLRTRRLAATSLKKKRWTWASLTRNNKTHPSTRLA